LHIPPSVEIPFELRSSIRCC